MTRRSMSLIAVLLALLVAGALVGSVAASGKAGDRHRGPEPLDAARRAVGNSVGERQTPESSVSASNCEDGVQASGAHYRICTPTLWNGDLVVYAHGYVASDRPVEIPEDQMVLPGTETTVDGVITSLGYYFATTSYYTNGLAVRPALSDLVDLVHIFTTTKGIPEHVYLVGVSEGGLITTLSVEQHPEVYDGGLAMCGPYGDFQDQINHFGDFRVVFDYFFPDVMPGDPLSIPVSLKEEWATGFFTETVLPTITHPSNITKVNELLAVTDVSPYAYASPTSTDSIEHLLWYNVFATNDGVAKLGGQPFDNADPYRWYSGSKDDELLNDPVEGVERIGADQAAQDEITTYYQTSGRLNVPLVTIHTTGDEIVPYRHALQYQAKTASGASSLFHRHIEVKRHGHCNFTQGELIGAFLSLTDMVENLQVTRVYLPFIARSG